MKKIRNKTLTKRISTCIIKDSNPSLFFFLSTLQPHTECSSHFYLLIYLTLISICHSSTIPDLVKFWYHMSQPGTDGLKIIFLDCELWRKSMDVVLLTPGLAYSCCLAHTDKVNDVYTSRFLKLKQEHLLKGILVNRILGKHV